MTEDVLLADDCRANQMLRDSQMWPAELEVAKELSIQWNACQ